MNLSISGRINKVVTALRSRDDFASLVRGAGGVFIFQVMGVAASYLLQVFLARWMGPVGLGNFNYAFNWGRLLAIVGDLGVTLSALKFVPDYHTMKDWSRLKGTLLSFTAVTILGSVILATILSLIFGFSPPQDIELVTLIVGLMLTPLIALKELYVQVLRAMNHIVLAYAPAHVSQHLIALFGAGAVFLAAGELSSLHAILALGASFVLVILVQIFGIIRSLPESVKKAKAKYETRAWIKTSIPMLMIRGFVTIMDRIDIVMVGLLLGSFATGIYSVAARMATLSSFALYAVDAITAPKISPLYNQGKTEQLQRIVRQSTRLSFFTSFALFAGLVIFADFLLSVFGPEFLQARSALLVLALAHLINSGLGPVGYLMHLTDHQKESTRIHAAAVAVNISLNLLLIPAIGIEGAAIATACATLFQNTWMYFAVRKHLGIDTLPIRIRLR